MLVTSMLMTSFTPLMANAEELPDEDTEYQEEIMDIADTEKSDEIDTDDNQPIIDIKLTISGLFL